MYSKLIIYSILTSILSSAGAAATALLRRDDADNRPVIRISAELGRAMDFSDTPHFKLDGIGGDAPFLHLLAGPSGFTIDRSTTVGLEFQPGVAYALQDGGFKMFYKGETKTCRFEIAPDVNWNQAHALDFKFVGKEAEVQLVPCGFNGWARMICGGAEGEGFGRPASC